MLFLVFWTVLISLFLELYLWTTFITVASLSLLLMHFDLFLVVKPIVFKPESFTLILENKTNKVSVLRVLWGGKESKKNIVARGGQAKNFEAELSSFILAVL